MGENRKKIDSKKNSKGLNQNLTEKNPILRFSIKCLIFVGIISAIIIYFDINGYFNPDETDNHTKRKWDSFYDFTLENNIDILLLGNSHLYTGINPKTLSASLGVNSFILAAPGTKIIDSYFCLKEALKKTKPKLVIIETYGINSFSPYDFKEGNLSDQLKSFSARKDFLSKMYSMPYIFSINNYLYAWSNTLRNHRYLFSNHKKLLKKLN